MEYTFTDFYNNKVKLSFYNEPYSKEPKHVWIICRYNDQWVLTKHRSRGIEFPGGKVEIGENPEQAAHREVMEETGAYIKHLHYVAQYMVDGKNDTIIKNVYFAEIEKIVPQNTYYETEGPVLLKTLPNDLKGDRSFSFMMKDDVVVHTVKYVVNTFLNKKNKKN